jgi:hypothetical protein
MKGLRKIVPAALETEAVAPTFLQVQAIFIEFGALRDG